MHSEKRLVLLKETLSDFLNLKKMDQKDFWSSFEGRDEETEPRKQFQWKMKKI